MLNRFRLRETNLNDAPKNHPPQGLPDSSSPLGRYYRWLLDDPTHKDYWAARATDRTATKQSRDKEED